MGVLQKQKMLTVKLSGLCNSKGRIAEEAGLVICAEVGPSYSRFIKT
ncbi:MAG: hypothetical protein ACLSA2_05630 [Candidatus Gastranaerophilaceae bacterium]